MTAWKAWEHSRDNMNVPVARTLYRDGERLFPLLKILVALTQANRFTGFQYFFVIVCMSTHLLFIYVADPKLVCTLFPLLVWTKAPSTRESHPQTKDRTS